MMLDVFRGLKNILKVNRVQTDGSVFRLHYHATVMILIAFSVIVTTKQFVGNPIECNHSKDVSEAVINAYCWITSTHTIITEDSINPRKISSLINEVGKLGKYPYPGIGILNPGEGHTIKYHKYYQWVCFMLFFQAVLFYIPRWLWKNWEGGKIQALIMDLNVSVCTEAEKKQKKKLLLDYLWCNLCHHNWWAWRYFLCELLCFVNVVGQLFLMDRFLDGQFMEYGIKVVKFLEEDQSTRVDPMILVFPRVTKCSFFKYGGSGTIETHDAICILPLNVVNEKIYIFLWFWFIVLAGLTSLVLLFRILIVFFPPVRILLLQMRFRLLPREQIKALCAKSKIGDWFLFYMLGQNVDTLIFRDIFNDLTSRVELNGSEPAV